MLAAIAYKLSQLRVDTQKVDRNLAVLSASMSFKLNRTNRDEITALRHLALQEAHLAVEENKAMIDVEQSIRNRLGAIYGHIFSTSICCNDSI